MMRIIWNVKNALTWMYRMKVHTCQSAGKHFKIRTTPPELEVTLEASPTRCSINV